MVVQVEPGSCLRCFAPVALEAQEVLVALVEPAASAHPLSRRDWKESGP